MPRYTPCTGWKQEPARVYKAVRHRILYNGRNHTDPGVGQCRVCLRITAVHGKANTRPFIGRHSPKRKSWDVRCRQRWEQYAMLGVGAPRITNNYIRQAGGQYNWAGPIIQSITMTNNATILPYGADRMQYVPMTHQMHIEVTSDTQNAQGQYVFNVNGMTYVNPERRMTLVTDHLVWNQWANTITVSATTFAANNTLWNDWSRIGNQGAFNAAHAAAVDQVFTPRRVPAYDQVARAEDLFRRVDAEQRYKQEAAVKAEATLLELLTEEQAESYRTRQFFHIRGSRGRLYRIHKGTSGNIRRVRSEDEEGRGEAAFCVHSQGHTTPAVANEVGIVPGYLPHQDHMIQQMLHLMIDEDEILAKANVHWGTREPAADYEVRESGLLVAAG